MIFKIRIFLFFLFLVGFKFWVPFALAHSGTGPPFLSINGKLANTNPYSSAMEDFGPQNYLTGQPITFSLDMKALNIPPSVAENSKFRWSFSNSNKNYEYGQELSHTFTIPQTYFVTLDALPPETETYVPLDTIQINVLPNNNYHLPKDTISVRVDSIKSTSPIQFLSNVTLDPSATSVSYFWDFGDGDSSREKNPTHIYQGTDFAYLVSLKLTDSNKFVTYTGLIAGANNGKLYFEDPFTKNKKISVHDASQDTIPYVNKLLLPFVIVLVVSIGIFVVVRKKTHKK